MKKLVAETRELTGKKVSNLRKEGKLPAAIFGPKTKSTSVLFDNKEFRKLFRDAGHSKLVDIELEGKHNKAIIKEVQMHPVTRELIHASIYAVDMTKEIETEVPIKLEGLSPAVKNNIGFLSMPADTIKIRCLPENLQSEIIINIDTLENVGDGFVASQLKLGEGVALAPDQSPDELIVSIVPPQKEIVEEVAEVAAEGEAAEGEEGAKAEGAAGATQSPNGPGESKAE